MANKKARKPMRKVKKVKARAPTRKVAPKMRPSHRKPVDELESIKVTAPEPAVMPTGPVKFKIENIVASANLGVELDLYAIAQDVRDVEYEPEQFPGAILKLKEPRSSLLLFKNGKIICTGCKSEGEVGQAIMNAVKLLSGHAKKLREES